MKSLLFSLALAALPVCGGQPTGPLAPIALYAEFLQEPPAAVLDALRLEVQSIMAPAGLNFQWLKLADADGKQTSVELAVVKFRGRCDVAGLLPRNGNAGPLGWTHMSDGAILPFADVDCSAVRSFVQKELLFVRPADRAQVFGRALGRVLAHELYHIFANTTHHGTDGVAREFYGVHDLLAADFQFQSRESQVLLHSKAVAALAATPSPGADDGEASHRL
jgi:hypothetical protein